MAMKPIPEADRHALAMMVRGVNGGTVVSLRVSQLRELLNHYERSLYLEGRMIAAQVMIEERDRRITAARRCLKETR